MKNTQTLEKELDHLKKHINDLSLTIYQEVFNATLYGPNDEVKNPSISPFIKPPVKDHQINHVFRETVARMFNLSGTSVKKSFSIYLNEEHLNLIRSNIRNWINEFHMFKPNLPK